MTQTITTAHLVGTIPDRLIRENTRGAALFIIECYRLHKEHPERYTPQGLWELAREWGFPVEMGQPAPVQEKYTQLPLWAGEVYS